MDWPTMRKLFIFFIKVVELSAIVLRLLAIAARFWTSGFEHGVPAALRIMLRNRLMSASVLSGQELTNVSRNSGAYLLRCGKAELTTSNNPVGILAPASWRSLTYNSWRGRSG